MKKIEEIKLMEIDALQEMAEHVEIALNDIDIYKEYLSKKELRKAQKCRKHLGAFWNLIENKIIELFDADDRINRKEF